MLDNVLRGTICIEDIEIGMIRSIQKVVTDQDIEMFAEISTDHNPVHLDEEYAQETRLLFIATEQCTETAWRRCEIFFGKGL